MDGCLKIPKSKKRLPTHHKDIKLIVRKQLKNQFPNWKRLLKKTKKELAKKVLAEVVSEYDLKQAVKAPVEELLAIETQSSAKGITKLDEMARCAQTHTGNRKKEEQGILFPLVNECKGTVFTRKKSRTGVLLSLTPVGIRFPAASCYGCGKNHVHCYQYNLFQCIKISPSPHRELH
jgi:hypothetical protein